MNNLGKGVAIALLVLGAAVAAAFLRARVILTNETLVSLFGLSRHTIAFEDIEEVELTPGNYFGLMIPCLRLVGGQRVPITQIANRPKSSPPHLVWSGSRLADGTNLADGVCAPMAFA